MNVDAATLDTKAIASYTSAGRRSRASSSSCCTSSRTRRRRVRRGRDPPGAVLRRPVRLRPARARRARQAAARADRQLAHASSASSASSCASRRSAPSARWPSRSASTASARCCSLGKLMAGFYLTCLLFVFVVLGPVAWLAGFSIFKFIRYIREELLIVLGTSSSESALPRMIAKLENLGCAKSVVGLVIPTGYSFNLDGTCIYLTMAAIFLAQATNTPLTPRPAARHPRRAAADVEGRGRRDRQRLHRARGDARLVGTIPVASIALILGVDRFMSEARALTNLSATASRRSSWRAGRTRSTCRGCSGSSTTRPRRGRRARDARRQRARRQAGGVGGAARAARRAAQPEYRIMRYYGKSGRAVSAAGRTGRSCLQGSAGPLVASLAVRVARSGAARPMSSTRRGRPWPRPGASWRCGRRTRAGPRAA